MISSFDDDDGAPVIESLCFFSYSFRQLYVRKNLLSLGLWNTLVRRGIICSVAGLGKTLGTLLFGVSLPLQSKRCVLQLALGGFGNVLSKRNVKIVG